MLRHEKHLFEVVFFDSISAANVWGSVIGISPWAQLNTTSYYRLNAYWYPFRRRDKQEKFIDDFMEVPLDKVIELYEFLTIGRIIQYGNNITKIPASLCSISA